MKNINKFEIKTLVVVPPCWLSALQCYVYNIMTSRPSSAPANTKVASAMAFTLKLHVVQRHDAHTYYMSVATFSYLKNPSLTTPPQQSNPKLIFMLNWQFYSMFAMFIIS